MNKKILIRNLVVSLIFSAILGYAVYMFLQYQSYFDPLVRTIILVCVAALFVCIWWIFFVDLRAGIEEDPDDDDDDYEEDDDEYGYGNPDMMAYMEQATMEISLTNDEDEPVVLQPVKAQDVGYNYTPGSLFFDAPEEPEEEAAAETPVLNYEEAAPEYEIEQPAQSEIPSPESIAMPIFAHYEQETVQEEPEAVAAEPEYVQPEEEFVPVVEAVAEPEYVQPEEEFVPVVEAAAEPEYVQPEEEYVPVVEAAAEPEYVQPEEEYVPVVEAAAEPEYVQPEEEYVPAAEPAAPDFVEEPAPVEEIVDEPMAVTVAPVEVEDVLPPEQPAEPEKPDVNTVDLHALTPAYIALLDERERKILAMRISKEKRRRADARAQQEAIMRTQELQLYAQQQAARRMSELMPAMETVPTVVPQTAEERAEFWAKLEEQRAKAMRTREAIIRQESARRTQEEAAYRQALRAAQQDAVRREAERRVAEEAIRQEADLQREAERARVEATNFAYREAERIAREQLNQQELLRRAQERLAAASILPGDSFSSSSITDAVQLQLDVDRAEKAERGRIEREALLQRKQEEAARHMMELQRRRHEEENQRRENRQRKMAEWASTTQQFASITEDTLAQAAAEKAARLAALTAELSSAVQRDDHI